MRKINRIRDGKLNFYTLFLEMVEHPTAPLTNEELINLIKLNPSTWVRFSNWIGKLEN